MKIDDNMCEVKITVSGIWQEEKALKIWQPIHLLLLFWEKDD